MSRLSIPEAVSDELLALRAQYKLAAETYHEALLFRAKEMNVSKPALSAAISAIAANEAAEKCEMHRQIAEMLGA